MRSSTTDPELELKLLKERVRKLEFKQRRPSIIYVDDDHVIDGTCSRSCWQYFVELVTIPGVKSLVVAKHALAKSLWILAFVIGVCLTMYYVYRSVTTYFAEPTATKVNEQVKLKHLENYTYSDMLLCPDTWLDVDKALEAGATIPALQYGLGYLMNYYRRPPPYKIDDHAEAKLDFDEWYRRGNYSNLVHLFTSVALDSEKFIYKCPECKNLTFTKVYMDESICYQIHMRDVAGKGTARGTVDILEVKIPDRSGGLLPRKKYWRFYMAPDLAVGVSTVQFSQIFPGHSNTIKFTPVRFTMLDKPKDPCKEEHEVLNEKYSRIECALKCSNKRAKCADLGEIRQTTLRKDTKNLCHYYPRYYWIYLGQISKQTNLAEVIPSKCFEKCPPPCRRWLYEVTVESHEISKQDDSNGTRLTRIYLSNQAPVQHGFMSFEEVNTFSFAALVGNVGGDLGLWLGVSVIALIQMFVFFVSWCLARYWNKARDWKKQHNEEEGNGYALQDV